MTTEEKAKAYDEALDKIRKLYAGANGSLITVTKAWLEKIFPELRESEDERIRKELLNFVKSFWADHKEKLPQASRWVSYLKKQKEQKPTSFNEPYNPDEYEVVMEGNATSLKRKEQKPAMIQWTGKNLKEVIGFTGKSPKFGEWFKSWEDFENYVHSHSDILKLFCEDGSHYEVPVGAWIIKTPDGYNIPSRFKLIQKPVEWSEEDEKALKIVTDVFKKAGVHLIHYPALLSWLKSLRPQPRWKPSDEQMKVMKEAIVYFGKSWDDPKQSTLESIYEQLKKL